MTESVRTQRRAGGGEEPVAEKDKVAKVSPLCVEPSTTAPGFLVLVSTLTRQPWVLFVSFCVTKVKFVLPTSTVLRVTLNKSFMEKTLQSPARPEFERAAALHGKLIGKPDRKSTKSSIFGPHVFFKINTHYLSSVLADIFMGKRKSRQSAG